MTKQLRETEWKVIKYKSHMMYLLFPEVEALFFFFLLLIAPEGKSLLRWSSKVSASQLLLCLSHVI